MRGKQLFIISVLLALSASLAAGQQPDYFPLHVGNQWIYRQTGTGAGEPVVASITEAAVFEGRYYSRLRGMPEGNAWLRMAEDGTLFAYDPDQGRERVWTAFFAPVGETYRTEITECNSSARIESRSARLQIPVGDFANALHVVYPPSGCADAGITADYYLPWVGLVQRTMTTIAGPRTLDLIYARLGGVTVVSVPELSFSLTLDRSVYQLPSLTALPPIPVMTARLTLRNTQPEPVKLTFPSGQRFDVVLKNEKGETVFRWSDGKAFTLVLGTESVGPGERNYVVVVPLADRNGKALPPGNYVAEAWLTTMGQRAYSASVGFEIR